MRRRLLRGGARSWVSTRRPLIGRVILVETPESIVIAKYDNRTKTMVRTPLIEDLVATIPAIRHRGHRRRPVRRDLRGRREQQQRGEMGRRPVARGRADGRSRLLLVHHTRKYASDMAGDADASRGGGALIGMARILVTLFAMTEDEARRHERGARGARGLRPLRRRQGQLQQAGAGALVARRRSPSATPRRSCPGTRSACWCRGSRRARSTASPLHVIGLALDEIDRGLLDENGVQTGQRYTAAVTSDHKSRWAGTRAHARARLLRNDSQDG